MLKTLNYFWNWLFKKYFWALQTLMHMSSTEKPVSPKGTQLTKNYYSVVSENYFGYFT